MQLKIANSFNEMLSPHFEMPDLDFSTNSKEELISWLKRPNWNNESKANQHVLVSAWNQFVIKRRNLWVNYKF